MTNGKFRRNIFSSLAVSATLSSLSLTNRGRSNSCSCASISNVPRHVRYGVDNWQGQTNTARMSRFDPLKASKAIERIPSWKTLNGSFAEPRYNSSRIIIERRHGTHQHPVATNKDDALVWLPAVLLPLDFAFGADFRNQMTSHLEAGEDCYTAVTKNRSSVRSPFCCT